MDLKCAIVTDNDHRPDRVSEPPNLHPNPAVTQYNDDDAVTTYHVHTFHI